MCTPSETYNNIELEKEIVRMPKKYKKTMLVSLMELEEGITNKKILARGEVHNYTYD